jgi:hypothetical protein
MKGNLPYFIKNDANHSILLKFFSIDSMLMQIVLQTCRHKDIYVLSGIKLKIRRWKLFNGEMKSFVIECSF